MDLKLAGQTAVIVGAARELVKRLPPDLAPKKRTWP